jgi:RNA polymerase sigma-70 factor (ECF subfamily)
VQPEGNPVSRELLNAALTGDRSAVLALVRVLRPIIQSEVAAVLARSRGSMRGRNIAQEVDDFVQEVFVGLFASDARALRRFDPAIAPLEAYVRGIAFHDAISRVRSRPRSPFTEDPTEPGDFEPTPESEPDPESSTISRDLLQRLVVAVRSELGPRGGSVFELLVLRERPVEEVCQALEMSEDAVYAWRSRIGKLARKVRDDLLSERLAGARTR